MPPEKLFVDPRSFYVDSFRLGRAVYDSGFRPTFLVALWRGGTVPGMIVHEVYKFKGETLDHVAVRTGRYSGIDEKDDGVKIYGLGYVTDRVTPKDPLLVVDDVWDEGRTVDALLAEIHQRARMNTPEDIRVATVFFKPTRNRSFRKPDYFIRETNEWIVFPHELEGLSLLELMRKDPEIAAIVGEAA